jgi:hypothetical protein
MRNNCSPIFPSRRVKTAWEIVSRYDFALISGNYPHRVPTWLYGYLAAVSARSFQTVLEDDKGLIVAAVPVLIVVIVVWSPVRTIVVVIPIAPQAVVVAVSPRITEPIVGTPNNAPFESWYNVVVEIVVGDDVNVIAENH